MQASQLETIIEKVDAVEVSEGAQETAARISALLRHLFLYDRGNLLRVIEESGLSMTQSKALLELGGLGEATETRQVSDLAEVLGVSVPSMSRAVDGLVKKRLATRVEDSEDRRVQRIAITAKGKQLVDTLIVVRQAGTETFAASLTAAQRRKLDAAVDSLMDRPDIAETFEHMKEWTSLTRYRHLITDDNRKWWTLGAMCFALFMIMLDNTVVNVALPSIQRDLRRLDLRPGVDGQRLHALLRGAAGDRWALGDIFGRRRMFLFGVVIFALSSATAGFAVSSTDLVISRVVQGVGAALMMPATLSIITDAFPASGARQGDGDVGGRFRPGSRGRPGGGRLAHRARQLAGDLLPQHPGRDRRRHRRRCSPCASRATTRSAARSTTPASPC